MSAHPDFSAFKVNPKYWTILNSIIEWNVDTVTVAQITTKHHLRLSTVAQAFDEFVKRGVLKEVKKPKSDVPVYKLTEAVKKAYVAPPAPKYESKNENMWSDRGELTDTCYQALYDGAKSIQPPQGEREVRPGLAHPRPLRRRDPRGPEAHEQAARREPRTQTPLGPAALARASGQPQELREGPQPGRARLIIRTP